MKHILHTTVLAVLILVFYASLPAQPTEGISGVWLTEKRNTKIDIRRGADGRLEGQVIWGIAAPGEDSLDTMNPDPKLRTRPRLGLIILKEFTQNSPTEWGGGTIYDPQNGKTYRCILTVDNDSTLNVRGYVGIPLFGRSEKWTRISSESSR